MNDVRCEETHVTIDTSQFVICVPQLKEGGMEGGREEEREEERERGNAEEELYLCIQVNEKICNLEREYRDCIKSRRDKIRITRHIMMHQVLYNVHVTLGNCTIYSTWCIMICLVILILSLLLFIQSLSKLLVRCPFFATFSNYT